MRDDEKSGTRTRTMRELVAHMEAVRATVFDAQRVAAVDAQHARGKLTARERIHAMVDADSFVEVGALTTAEDHAAREVAPCDALIAGSARIDGRPVALTATDFMAMGGSSGVTGGLKIAAQVEQCLLHGYPCIALADGGGHRMQEGLDSRHFAAGNDHMLAMVELSGWVPVVSALLGPGFAGPANGAAMSDLVVAVRGISTIGVAGPPLVRAAIGKHFTKEELGDPDQQAAKHGILDLVVDNEAEAFAAIRRFLSYLPSNAAAPLPHRECTDPIDRRDDALLDLVPADLRRGYDMRRVIQVIADADSVFELKATHAKNIITAFARFGGHPVGVIANQPMFFAGAIDSAAAEKAAHFISLCDAFGLPLVYLVDTPGLLVGPDAEKTGLARRSAKLLFELGRATVPRLSIVLRKGYGLGYLAMNGGRSFHADLALAWPTAEISAMSVVGAVDLMHRREIENAPNPAAKRQQLIDTIMPNTGWLRAAEGFGVDDVIDPRDTRFRIVDTLRRCARRRPTRHVAKVHPITPI